MSEIFEIFKQIKVRRLNLIVSTVLFVLCALFLKTSLDLNKQSISRDLFSQFPNELGDWKGVDAQGLDIRSLDILRLSSYVTKRYVDSKNRSVYVYIGYWANQTGEYQAAKHSPALCLPSNGWQTSHLSDKVIGSDKYKELDGPVNLRRIIGSKRTDSELFYYWFFSGQRYYSQEWLALINLSMSNLLYGRSDGGIVEISTSIHGDSSRQTNIDNADNTLNDFLADFFPLLHARVNEVHATGEN